MAANAALDDAMSRRLKAFACTAPLHDLDGRKSRLDFADANVYQMAEIGLMSAEHARRRGTREAGLIPLRMLDSTYGQTLDWVYACLR